MKEKSCNPAYFEHFKNQVLGVIVCLSIFLQTKTTGKLPNFWYQKGQYTNARDLDNNREYVKKLAVFKMKNEFFLLKTHDIFVWMITPKQRYCEGHTTP